ncbi:MAG: putative molybdenum carrier protein [Opitutales bacterium]|nr:putative molybdenum carrier protein [Opitutales bacterium]
MNESLNNRSLKIISGGQTGVDRAALDVALNLGIQAGGFCPKDRWAEDGPIPDRYPVREIDGGVEERTLMNVIHSDGTLIFFNKTLSGGSFFTKECCVAENTPYLLFDLSNAEKSYTISDFISQNTIHVLNIAGPRASEEPGIYKRVFSLLNDFFQKDCIQ